MHMAKVLVVVVVFLAACNNQSAENEIRQRAIERTTQLNWAA